MEFSPETLNNAFQNTIILKDKKSLEIINEVCKEKNISLEKFAELIIWTYQNKNSTMQGVNERIDELLNSMK